MQERKYTCATCNTAFTHDGVGRPPKNCESCRETGVYICADCGRTVTYIPSRRPPQLCKECRVPSRACRVCGKPTQRVAASGPAPATCSAECLRATATAKARQYRRDPAVRERERERDRATRPIACRDCGKRVPFQGAMRKARCADCWPTYESRRLREKNWKKLGIALSVEQYAEMYEGQQGCCAICGRPEDVLHVDHCHTTSRIRALLCGNCNRGLGMFADDPARLLAAADYLGGPIHA